MYSLYFAYFAKKQQVKKNKGKALFLHTNAHLKYSMTLDLFLYYIFFNRHQILVT